MPLSRELPYANRYLVVSLLRQGEKTWLLALDPKAGQ